VTHRNIPVCASMHGAGQEGRRGPSMMCSRGHGLTARAGGRPRSRTRCC
jgi:hypothetical protein